MRRFGLLVAAALAVSCGDGEDSFAPTPGVTLVVAPTTVTLTPTAPEATVTLTTQPSGRLTWRIQEKPNWIKLTPESGRLNLQISEVKVSVIDSLAPQVGNNFGLVRLISEGGVAGFSVTAQIAARPIASLRSNAVTFAAERDTVSTWLRSTGTGPLTWSAQSSVSWLRVAPANGTLQSGDSVRLLLTANREPLPVGTATGSVVITSNSATGNLTLNASVSVAAIAGVRVTEARLAYPVPVTQESFYVVNSGKAPLIWNIQSSQGFLTATPSSGTTQPRDSALVTVAVDRATATNNTATLTVKSNAPTGDVLIEAAIGLSAVNTNVPVTLDHRVVDAEFSAATGVIVTVSAAPSPRLNIIDPELGLTQSVALTRAPTAVSVAPSGRYAAVGHDAAVSYVNLILRQVERVYVTTTDAVDVILGDRGWMYVLPRRDQWENVYSINLSTGVQETSGTIYAGTVGKLHPSGDFIYLADRGLSPSDIEKFDLRAGRAVAMYDSPYHGDYPFSGDLWFLEDGSRLIARSNHVFRVSEARNEDLTYAGKLSGIGTVLNATHSAETRRIYAFESPGFVGPASPDLWVFDSEFLGMRNRVPLPKFSANITSYGQFVFVNDKGTRLYMLVKADASGGLANDWAYVILNTTTVNGQ